MTTMQDQATRRILKHSDQLVLDSIDTHQPRAPLIGTPLAGDNFHEESLELDLDNSVLLGFCNRHLLTTCSVFQTAWAVVVSCYAEVQDVSFRYGTNERELSDSKAEQSYLCRAQIDPKGHLLDTLLVAEKHVDKVLNHSGYSNAECSNQSSDRTTSLFDSRLYVSHQLGQRVDRVKQDETLSRYLISARFTIKDDDSISVSIRARASNFSVAQVGNMVHTLGKTLNEITKARPQSLIEDLDICSRRDLKKIMDWNQSKPDLVESCFHWHFETVARRTPDATAICSWDRNFTYLELDTVSTKLANNLRHLGVMPGIFVGICFNKTAMAYVCMLGILKAGGAFVAIDPSYPASRIQIIVESTKASIFVAEPMHCHLFDEFTQHTMAMDTKIIDKLPHRSSSVGPQSDPSDIAYAVFTSGSTGSPKGIMIEHRSLHTAALALASPMQIDSSSRVLQFAAYTFDVSYGDTFITLAQGGCICVPSEQERLNDISGAVMRMSVNNACLIPSVARMLRPKDVPCLRVLLLGGEALVKDNLDTWAEKVNLSVVYGPSECTVWCASQTALKVDSPPNIIGRGAGALLWVTSATNHDRLCPIGCIGELLIEGPGLARGYLDAEQTRSAFIEDPSWARTKPGCRRRFYKTGDLVRYQPDGTLSFLGRKDTQIKLHGRRIELGEIEYHLSCHDLLRQSMVLLPGAGLYRQKLVAIVAFKTNTVSNDRSTELKQLTGITMQRFASELAKIKTFLSSRVPFYMLPQEWIVVEDIPLMISGKMNRVQSRNFVESLTKAVHEDTTDTSLKDRGNDNLLENHLQKIWSEVLDINVDEVGIEDGFISLGGDSFTAMDLVARCKAEGYTFTVADLLKDSTVRQMAAEARISSPRAAGSAHKDTFLPIRHKFAAPKPLVLYPVWWRTDCSSTAIS